MPEIKPTDLFLGDLHRLFHRKGLAGSVRDGAVSQAICLLQGDEIKAFSETAFFVVFFYDPVLGVDMGLISAPVGRPADRPP